MRTKLGVALGRNEEDGTARRHDHKPARQIDVGRHAARQSADDKPGRDDQYVEHDHPPQPQRVARSQRQIAAREHSQAGRDRARERDSRDRERRSYPQRRTRGELARRHGPQALARMLAVLLAVAHVVDQVGGARDHAQDEKRTGGLCGDSRSIDPAGRSRSGEHEHVLAPLARPARPQHHAARDPDRPASARGWRPPRGSRDLAESPRGWPFVLGECFNGNDG